jgi:hypothetical protein
LGALPVSPFSRFPYAGGMIATVAASRAQADGAARRAAFSRATPPVSAGVVTGVAVTAEPAAVRSVDPAVQALLDLYEAHRHQDEDHRQCFARMGARTYAALLDEVLGQQLPEQVAAQCVPVGA